MRQTIRVITMAVAAALFFAAAPSQSLAQGKPPVASADPAPIQLAETRWAGRAEWSDGEAKDWTLYFRADGVLIYGYEGQTFDNGRWRQRDMLVNFDTNDYFALYVGHVRGDVFSGEMFNIRGQRGTFSFQRR